MLRPTFRSLTWRYGCFATILLAGAVHAAHAVLPGWGVLLLLAPVVGYGWYALALILYYPLESDLPEWRTEGRETRRRKTSPSCTGESSWQYTTRTTPS